MALFTRTPATAPLVPTVDPDAETIAAAEALDWLETETAYQHARLTLRLANIRRDLVAA